VVDGQIQAHIKPESVWCGVTLGIVADSYVQFHLPEGTGSSGTSTQRDIAQHRNASTFNSIEISGFELIHCNHPRFSLIYFIADLADEKQFQD
jgi:hypothetical protein